MRNAARHLSQRAQALLLHDGLFDLAEFRVGRTHLVFGALFFGDVFVHHDDIAHAAAWILDRVDERSNPLLTARGHGARLALVSLEGAFDDRQQDFVRIARILRCVRAPEAFPRGIHLDRSAIDREYLYSKRRLFHQRPEALFGNQQGLTTPEAQREAHGNDHEEEGKRTEVYEIDDLRAN